MPSRSLVSGFLRSCQRFPDRFALEVGGEAWTYDGLFREATRVAATVDRVSDSDETLVAVLAHRSGTAFAGILGALLAGRGYVPLNPTYPPERTWTMLERSGCRTVVVDHNGRQQLDTLLGYAGESLRLILPDHEGVKTLAERWPAHDVLGADSMKTPSHWQAPNVDSDAIAYLLFTSGSTGIPKGVGVTHRNIASFLDFVTAEFEVTHEDRLTQMFDMTFDLSVFDMFAAWERGACVCCPSLQERALPSRFVNDSRATIWFSVPSTGLLMQKLRLLKAGAFPNLRLSLFCGEALTNDLAAVWATAAPNSQVINLYGPTELTLACTLYRWRRDHSVIESEHGLVPIGEPFPRMNVLVADRSLNEVEIGDTGELLMTGPQMAPGYWKDPETTAKSFVTPAIEDAVFYRTGDLVRRPSEGRPLIYLGRLDHQLKVQGYRVEVGEIEAAIRESANVELAVALGWPVTSAGAQGIVAFVEGERVAEDVVGRLQDQLPHYMMPSQIVPLSKMPLTANGKVDRKALIALLEN